MAAQVHPSPFMIRETKRGIQAILSRGAGEREGQLRRHRRTDFGGGYSRSNSKEQLD